MFGSTIEYVLRTYTNEYCINKIESEIICNDGSMHAYQKQFHHNSVESLKASLTQLSDSSISTPIYPFKNQHLTEILSWYSSYLPTSNNVLIYADSLRAAELNLLFQYHKIAFGSTVKLGLDIFCGDNSHNLKNWNKNYTHWTDMEPWQLREWFSLFYPTWISEWRESVDQVDHTFLKISNSELLYNTKDTFEKIIKHCNLTQIGDLDSFLKLWASKQQYIVDQFDLLDKILETTLNQIDFSWPQLNVICEAIIQQRLREKKIEIQCDGLNIFPTNSKLLYNLLENV